MRTTLTINDEIDARLRKIARNQNRSYKEVVNDALASGLDALLASNDTDFGRFRALKWVDPL